MEKKSYEKIKGASPVLYAKLIYSKKTKTMIKLFYTKNRKVYYYKFI